MFLFIEFEMECFWFKVIGFLDVGFIFEFFNMFKWLEFIGDCKVYSIVDVENYIFECICL